MREGGRKGERRKAVVGYTMRRKQEDTVIMKVTTGGEGSGYIDILGILILDISYNNHFELLAALQNIKPQVNT